MRYTKCSMRYAALMCRKCALNNSYDDVYNEYTVPTYVSNYSNIFDDTEPLIQQTQEANALCTWHSHKTSRVRRERVWAQRELRF